MLNPVFTIDQQKYQVTAIKSNHKNQIITNRANQIDSHRMLRYNWDCYTHKRMMSLVSSAVHAENGSTVDGYRGWTPF